MQKKIKILVVDDHVVIRLAVKVYVKNIFSEATVEEVASFDQAQEKVKEEQYDLIILDLNLPGLESQRLLQFLTDKNRKTRILIFSSNSEEDYALRYLRAGANGYLDKSASSEEIRKALQLVVKTGRYISSTIQEKLIQESIGQNNHKQRSIDKLSDRELEVASLLSKGKSNQEITNHLSIHPSTVSTIKKRIFQKLDVSNIIELKEFLY